MSKAAVRVMCVDDHSFLVEGLRAKIESAPDLDFVGSLNSAANLVASVRELQPDVVLLDIEMPGPDPFESADDVRRLCPDTRIVFLSAHVRDHYISAAIKAGAWGYFSKSDDPEAILTGVRTVAAGTFAFGPKVQERCQPVAGSRKAAVEPPKTRLDALSPREQEVLRLIGKGKTRTEIAETLSRSPKTIDGHRESIMTKLDIHDRAELVRFAIREGLAEL
jgi:two-component system response regulator NreC